MCYLGPLVVCRINLTKSCRLPAEEVRWWAPHVDTRGVPLEDSIGVPKSLAHRQSCLRCTRYSQHIASNTTSGPGNPTHSVFWANLKEPLGHATILKRIETSDRLAQGLKYRLSLVIELERVGSSLAKLKHLLAFLIECLGQSERLLNAYKRTSGTGGNQPNKKAARLPMNAYVMGRLGNLNDGLLYYTRTLGLSRFTLFNHL